MDIRIRREEPKDYRRVEEITREAFWNLYRPGCDEHFAAHQLRKHKDFLPELTFVMEADGELVGSILYSRSKVVGEGGQEWETISFGPVCILPRLHRQGLGRMLITHSMEEAKRLGYSSIVICGYPYHYEPYGFQGAKKYGISLPDGQFYTGVMALSLVEGGFRGVRGSIHFCEALETPNPEALEAYDSTFPPKAKGWQPSHEEFERACAQVDTREF